LIGARAFSGICFFIRAGPKGKPLGQVHKE